MSRDTLKHWIHTSCLLLGGILGCQAPLLLLGRVLGGSQGGISLTPTHPSCSCGCPGLEGEELHP